MYNLLFMSYRGSRFLQTKNQVNILRIIDILENLSLIKVSKMGRIWLTFLFLLAGYEKIQFLSSFFLFFLNLQE